jgi:hypothetical protein
LLRGTLKRGRFAWAQEVFDVCDDELRVLAKMAVGEVLFLLLDAGTV